MIKSEANLVFKKPNSAIVMMPKVGKLSAISRKIFNVILSTTQKQFNKLTSEGKVVEATHYFSSELSALVGPVEVGQSNLTTLAKKSLLEMRRTEVDWEAPDKNSEVIWSNMSLLSEIKIIKTRNVLYAYWALPPGLLSVIADPQRYTPLDITELAKLKTYSAIALYEICSRYKNNPTGLTSENTLEWWVNALSHAAAKTDPDTKKPKLRLWSKFKNEHVVDAITEINAKSDIKIELIEKRTGRAITSAQFKVWRKNEHAPSSKPSLSLKTAVLADEVGVPHSEILSFIKFGQNEDVLTLAMTRLKHRMDRADLPVIDSKVAYLKSVLEEKNRMISIPQTVEPPTIKGISYTVKTKEEGVLMTQRELHMKQAKEELVRMGKEEQKKYADIAFGILQKMNVASSLITKKYAAQEWTTGVLFSKMLEVYAIEKYGESWIQGGKANV